MTYRPALPALLLGSMLLGACASQPAGTTTPGDPWEPLNRRINSFNTTLDNATLKPIAKGYRKVLPNLARRGVSNFFSNLGTPVTALNGFLQGKPGDGFSDVGRFLMNSTVGLGGLLDVGTQFGLEQHDEDFGQTLAVWGIPDGPYVVVPFLGPSTLRDALAMPVDFVTHPLHHYENSSVRDKLRIVQAVDVRSRLLNAERLLKDSQDPYITLRESYLQNREYNVYDGNPPMDDFYDDMLEDDCM